MPDIETETKAVGWVQLCFSLLEDGQEDGANDFTPNRCETGMELSVTISVS